MVNLPQKYSVVQLYEKKVLDKLVTKKNILKPVNPILGNSKFWKKATNRIEKLMFFFTKKKKNIWGKNYNPSFSPVK